MAVHPLSMNPIPNVIASPTLIVAYDPNVTVIISETSQVGFLPRAAKIVVENT